MPTSEADNDDPANPQTAATTPRRSTAVRYPRNNGTTNKKAAANKASPARNGQVRGKAGGKKPEPTLLGDFLLGRPSADRVRRRSSGVQQAEVKASAVSRLQPPGGVKERVKQWQKTSAAAAIKDPAAPAKTHDAEAEADGDGDGGFQASGENNKPVATYEKKKKGNAHPPPKARGTPKKRVVSDSHWVKNRRKSPPRKPDLLLNLLVDSVTIKKGLAAKKDNAARLPKDFVKSNWANPPLASKIEDWARRTDELNAVPLDENPTEVANPLPDSDANFSATKAQPPAKFGRQKRLPKNFVKSNWANPPLERKILDWAERTDEVRTLPPKETREEPVDLLHDHASSSSAMKAETTAKFDKPKRIPKNFVKSSPANPPLEHKIQDWVHRTDEASIVAHNEPPEKSTDLLDESILTPRSRDSESLMKHDKRRHPYKEFVKSDLAIPPKASKIRDWTERTKKYNTASPEERHKPAPDFPKSAPKPTNFKKGLALNMSKPKGLPKDFVESHWANPPLERKMQDWAERMCQPDTIPYQESENSSLLASPTTAKVKPEADASTLNSFPRDHVESNLSNPPRDRKIRDRTERTERTVESEIVQKKERPVVTLPRTSRRGEDAKSPPIRKSSVEIVPLNTSQNHASKSSSRQSPVPSHADRDTEIKTMHRNDSKEDVIVKARTSSPAHNESKSTIGRRGAIHEANRRRPKKCEPAKGLEGTKQDEYANSQLRSADSVRRRTKEENARRQDRLANNKDPTRSRDLRTLALLKNAQIDQRRHVKAKEYFDLDLRHTNGQRMACEIEFIVRDSDSDAGDILICEVDARRRSHCLLFQPLDPNQISVRQGDLEDDLIVMVCGQHETIEWRECFILKAEHPDIVEEFLSMFSHEPTPPALSRLDLGHLDDTSCDIPLMSGALICLSAPDVPIGERVGFQDSTQQTSPQVKNSRALIDSSTMVNSNETNEGRFSYSNTAMEKRDLMLDPSQTTTSTTESQLSLKELSLDSERLLYGNQTSKDKERSRRATQISRTPQPDTVPNLHPTSQHLDLNTDPPPPPLHKENVSKITKIELPTSRNASYELKHRRSSSPLKNEYMPSHDSTTYSTSYFTDTNDEDSISESSTDYEEEAEDTVPRLPQIHKAATPSHKAAVPDILVQQPKETYCHKLSAFISCWRVPPGRWDDLETKICSIVVTPGSIEVFPKDDSHFSDGDDSNKAQPSTQPLLSLVLTPVVLIRQSNSLDVEIHSPPLKTSLLKSSNIIRFRSGSGRECRALYGATHQARQDNEAYNRLQNDRMLNDYNRQNDREWDERKVRYSWLGRKKSYRASARGSTFSESDKSAFSLSTKFSAFKRRSNGGAFSGGLLTFNRSRFEGSIQSRGSSLYGTSDSAHSTSTRTPTDPSVTTTDTTNNSVLDTNKMIIRLYRAAILSEWVEIGPCQIKIGAPEPGMNQVSQLNYGVPKQVTLTEFIKEKPAILNKHFAFGNSQAENRTPEVYFNGVIGARCFSRLQRVAIVMNVFEDVIGPNGEVGMPGAEGGISGKQRKWMFRCTNAAQAGLIFALLGGGI